jgi:6-phosphogluconate dehydrogenase
VLIAVDVGAPAAVLSAALFGCFASRGEADFADQLLSAMRKQFGGHAEITAAARWEPVTLQAGTCGCSIRSRRESR